MVYSTCSFTYLYDLIIWDWSFSDKDSIPINRYLHSESSSWLYRSTCILDGTRKPKDAVLRIVLSIIIKLEIEILNKFCSRLIFQYLSFSLVTFRGKFRNLKRESYVIECSIFGGGWVRFRAGQKDFKSNWSRGPVRILAYARTLAMLR